MDVASKICSGNTGTSAKVAAASADGAASVVVFGDIDSAVGINRLDPDDVSSPVSSLSSRLIGGSVGGRGSSDSKTVASSRITPSSGMAPATIAGKEDPVFFVSFPAGIAGALAAVTTVEPNTG